MWFFEIVRLFVDVLVVSLVIVLLWSAAFGHNRHYLAAANRQVRHVFNISNRKSFVRIFDVDPAFSESIFRSQAQERVDSKLCETALLVQKYEHKIKFFAASSTIDLGHYDSRMQLDNLIKSVQTHRNLFWQAHEVAKSCGFEVYPSIHDYFSHDQSGLV